MILMMSEGMVIIKHFLKCLVIGHLEIILSVPKDHILPFGMEHNFWEMGTTGPCGPCTEIHFDHTDTGSIKYINSGNANVIEIWNLVFIQYERIADGSLKKLHNYHVDTGMGLERLTAVLQNSRSNYDTDLFLPLFNVISQNCKVRPYAGKYGIDDCDGIDTAYRILADHARMITIAVSDGVQPSEFDAGNCLRRIIKKAVMVADNQLKASPSFVSTLIPYVVEILGEAFPEITENVAKSINIINEEEERLRYHIKQTDKFLDKIALKTKFLSGNDAFHLFIQSGLSEDLIEKMAKDKGLTVDESFREKIKMNLDNSKSVNNENQEKQNYPSYHVIEELEKMKIPCTNDEYKYNYTSCDHHYRFDPLVSEIVAVISANSNLTDIVHENGYCWLLMKETNFYSESGGQISDIGSIAGQEFLFKVEDVQKYQDYVFHWGLVQKGNAVPGIEVHLAFDKLHRVRCMRNHTATHILQAVLKQIFPSTHQTSSYIGPSYFQFGYSAKNALTDKQIEMIESNVGSFIKNQIDITRSVLPLQTAMLEPNITTMPQMIYPNIVNVITIGKDRPKNNLFSAELCCGTHLHNTSHVSSFVITSQRKVSQTERSLHVVTGKQAQSVIGFGNRLMEEVLQMEKIVEKEELKQVDNIEPDLMKSVIMDIKQVRKTLRDCLVPLRKQMTIYEKIDIIERKIKSLIKRYTKTKGIQKMRDEITKVMQNDKNYFVHKIETVGDENQLIKAAVETFGNKPVMFFIPNLGNNQVLCQCLVPPRYVASTFSAEAWMASVLEVLDGEGNSKKQNPKHFFSVTGKKMENLCKAIETSKAFAERHLKL
ncbi:alanine--tRNA ligase, cytoplasmic-like isoform X2 [Centruroides vittatus]|uniref:alanine--tRNA ligase, cytoplasmic-like isoform X2 n=1 Tax=Centruroides vittatus TaxID=120091 RepID=UPI00350FE9C1